MSIKILAVAPYPGLANLIKDLAVDFPQFDVTVIKADMDESLPLLKKYEEENFDFIISRGGTAKLLEKHTSIPVIEVQVSGYDVLRILTLLKGYESKIQMIGFSNIIHSFEAVSTLINMDILYSIITHENEVETALATAKENGIQVVVGDTITVRLAKGLGMQGVLITSGRESVLEAFNVILKMHQYISILEVKNQHFEQLLDNIDDGMAIVDSKGSIIRANQMFFNMFNIAEGEERRHSLFSQYPYFSRLIEKSSPDRVNKIEIHVSDKKYMVTSGKISRKSSTEDQFFIKFTNTNYSNYGFYMRYPQEMIGSFPQLIITGRVFTDAVLQAKEEIKRKFPICLYGEKGSGKRLFVNLLHSSVYNSKGSLIEIVISDPMNLSFPVFLKKLQEEDPSTVISVIGFENVAPNQQKSLYEQIESIKAQLVFSFPSDVFEKKLDSNFRAMLQENRIYIPPLRERMDELEEYVKAFIFQYNELYGKQIVGIQPEIMQRLRERSWFGNYFELREVVKQLVKHSDGEYIDESSLCCLDMEKDVKEERKADSSINLNQPLEMIERQIIQKVLEEEDMNQSRAAKRLGINRSTLWRKLKYEEEKGIT